MRFVHWWLCLVGFHDYGYVHVKRGRDPWRTEYRCIWCRRAPQG